MANHWNVNNFARQPWLLTVFQGFDAANPCCLLHPTNYHRPPCCQNKLPVLPAAAWCVTMLPDADCSLRLLVGCHHMQLRNARPCCHSSRHSWQLQRVVQLYPDMPAGTIRVPMSTTSCIQYAGCSQRLSCCRVATAAAAAAAAIVLVAASATVCSAWRAQTAGCNASRRWLQCIPPLTAKHPAAGCNAFRH